MEFFNHEIVKFISGVELFLHQGLIVGDAKLAGAQLIDAGKEHVADELERVVGALGEFGHVDEHGAQARRSGAHTPSIEQAFASFNDVIHALKFAGQYFVIVPELQEL